MPAARAESEICRFELPKQWLAGAMARCAQVVAVGGQRSSKAVGGRARRDFSRTYFNDFHEEHDGAAGAKSLLNGKNKVLRRLDQ